MTNRLKSYKSHFNNQIINLYLDPTPKGKGGFTLFGVAAKEHLGTVSKGFEAQLRSQPYDIESKKRLFRQSRSVSRKVSSRKILNVLQQS